MIDISYHSWCIRFVIEGSRHIFLSAELPGTSTTFGLLVPEITSGMYVPQFYGSWEGLWHGIAAGWLRFFLGLFFHYTKLEKMIFFPR